MSIEHGSFQLSPESLKNLHDEGPHIYSLGREKVDEIAEALIADGIENGSIVRHTGEDAHIQTEDELALEKQYVR